MANFNPDDLGPQARLFRSLWIYGQYQLAGLALSGLSIASMLVADRSVLSREPNLALLYIAALAVPVGAWGFVKAVRFFAATAQPMPDGDLQAR